ncbi:hypothetical protein C9374_014175 [Naegleria lovaniensis]|uniref:FERM domain-containing protein n=1 Tax=Naegleria lovaniensis TaxID=51637 RepID=A0AA88GVD2_NAELO|nr:uncharacterized protein C9374_014175 [Naegleria lovaniensis]KAG2389615.1 hypothetical protein C9374_014175 [Naegleria lovaniensis]
MNSPPQSSSPSGRMRRAESPSSSSVRSASPTNSTTSGTKKASKRKEEMVKSQKKNGRSSVEAVGKNGENEKNTLVERLQLAPDQVLLTIEVIGVGNVNIVAEKDTDLIDVFDTLRSKIGMNEFGMQFFGLLEQVYDSEGSMPLGRFVNLQRTIQEENITTSSNLKFVLRTIKRPVDMKDSVAESIMVKQIHLNFINRLYKCTEKQAVYLASLILQINFGDYNPEKHKIGFLNKIALNTLLPVSVAKHDNPYWQERLFRVHKQHQGLSTRDAIYKYLEEASKTSHFGMKYFYVEHEVGPKQLMGIAEDGIFFFSNLSPKPDCWRWRKIKTWTTSMTNEGKYKIELERVGNDNEKISIITSKMKHGAILFLIQDYYSLLPEDMRTCQVQVQPNPLASLYQKPLNRIFLAKVSSRIEYLMGYYCEMCARAKLVPNPVYCRQLDNALDDDTTLTSLSLRALKIHDKILAYYLDPIETCLIYQPNINFSWKENFTLESFDFGYNEIKIEVPRLLHVLTYFRYLKYLNLSVVPLNEHSNILSSFLLQLTNLQELEIAKCGLKDKSMQTILMALCKCKQLQKLNLSKNHITNNALEHVTSFLETVKLKHLNMSLNEIAVTKKDTMVMTFFKTLETNLFVSTLNVSGIKLGEKGGEYIIEFIRVTSTLKDVTISNAGIEGKVFYSIGRLLRNHPSVERLDISMNTITKGMTPEEEDEAWYFLSVCKMLKQLDISDNQIFQHSLDIISKYLIENKTLTVLSLAGNPVTAIKTFEISATFCQAISAVPTLFLLDVTSCKIATKGVIDIFEAVSKNNSIKELYIGRNFVKNFADVSHVFRELKLRVLDLRQMRINDKNLDQLIPHLRANKHIEIINFEGNQITFAGLENFLKRIGRRSVLKKVAFVGNTLKDPQKKLIFQQFLHHTNIHHVVL